MIHPFRRKGTTTLLCLGLLALGAPVPPIVPAASGDALRVSVYATAGDVRHYLGSSAGREKALPLLQSVRVSRVFLEGRRGDEHAPPSLLKEVRGFLEQSGIHSSGGIATVPGSAFGLRQNGGLDWLNWQNPKTQADVAAFFAENAPLFDELIVDDFFCTSDTSLESGDARGKRSWSDYRRDLLVSLIGPMMLDPSRQARPQTRLIIKFPQWYDRFHLFGYDPPRMAAQFDQVWVGTEVRNPKTRRMGFVQPTEGYMNFMWLKSVAGSKTVGAWFDHIECTPQNFVDQAYQSVLAGAGEITLFHLGDLMENHPGDALLARNLPDLTELAGRLSREDRRGVAFYKPPGSEADNNLYLMDYLGMIGWPILPCAQYPTNAHVVVLAAQAAADPRVLGLARDHLKRGATLVVTPAFVRRVGQGACDLAGVLCGRQGEAPLSATNAQIRSATATVAVTLTTPIELDEGLHTTDAEVLIQASGADGSVPFLTQRKQGAGQVICLNVHTFSAQDFRAGGEWLLAPRPCGLSDLAQPVADELRRLVLTPLRISLNAPAGVGFHLFSRSRCLYNFNDQALDVLLDGKPIKLDANQCLWLAAP